MAEPRKRAREGEEESNVDQSVIDAFDSLWDWFLNNPTDGERVAKFLITPRVMEEIDSHRHDGAFKSMWKQICLDDPYECDDVTSMFHDAFIPQMQNYFKEYFIEQDRGEKTEATCECYRCQTVIDAVEKFDDLWNDFLTNPERSLRVQPFVHTGTYDRMKSEIERHGQQYLGLHRDELKSMWKEICVGMVEPGDDLNDLEGLFDDFFLQKAWSYFKTYFMESQRCHNRRQFTSQSKKEKVSSSVGIKKNVIHEDDVPLHISLKDRIRMARAETPNVNQKTVAFLAEARRIFNEAWTAGVDSEEFPMFLSIMMDGNLNGSRQMRLYGKDIPGKEKGDEEKTTPKEILMMLRRWAGDMIQRSK
jgi:hypothetical protein